MATQQAQDDGLIILSDESTISGIELPQPMPIPSAVSQDSIIDFGLGELVASNASSPVTISLPTNPSTTSSANFSFDLGIENNQIPSSSPTIPLITLSPEINLNSSLETKKEETISSLPIPVTDSSSKIIGDDADMDSILDGTIAKFKSRQEIIGQTKGKKTSRITELKKQIEELQQQVTDLDEDVIDLDDESTRITTNITALENMKMFEKAQEEEKMRAHNLKKVAKK